MSTTLNIRLEAPDVLQIIDALNDRLESWSKTMAILNGRTVHDELFIPEECSHADEAEEIVNHFRDIIKKIEEQLPDD